MSTMVTCRVNMEIREIHKVSDEIEYKISLLNLVEEGEMNEIYEEVLLDLGAEKNEEGLLELDVNGVIVEIEPSQRKARAYVDDTLEINIDIDETHDIYAPDDDDKKAHEKAEKIEKEKVDSELNRQKQAHEEQIKHKLEDNEDAIREKIRESINESHKEALRRKADRLGKVMSDSEETLENGDNHLTLEIDLG